MVASASSDFTGLAWIASSREGADATVAVRCRSGTGGSEQQEAGGAAGADRRGAPIEALVNDAHYGRALPVRLGARGAHGEGGQITLLNRTGTWLAPGFVEGAGAGDRRGHEGDGDGAGRGASEAMGEHGALSYLRRERDIGSVRLGGQEPAKYGLERVEPELASESISDPALEPLRAR